MSKNKINRKIQQYAMKGDLAAIFQLYENYSALAASEEDKENADKYLKQCVDFLEYIDANEEPANQLTISRIELIDFRKFKSLNIDFSEKTTVIIGNNGSGKTAIVESVAKVLSWISAGIETEGKNAKRIEYSDINVTCPHYADINFDFLFGKTTKIKGVLSRAIKGTEEKRDSNVSEIKSLASVFRVTNASFNINLPVFAYYSVNRASEKINHTFDIEKIQDIRPKGKLDIYEGALDGDGQFSKFIDWFLFIDNIADQANEELHEQLSSELQSLHEAIKNIPLKLKATFDEIISTKETQIKIVEQRVNSSFQKLRKHVLLAISGVVKSVTDLKVDRKTGRAEIKVKNDGVWVNINQLSQGQKVMLGMVADLALKMVMLNSKLKDPLKGRGIVLIDEIELHLHPKWQQQIILSLNNFFPNVQFIVTTHSPHILSTVDKYSIRILKENEIGHVEVEVPDFQTKGVASSDVLEQLMHTFSIPPIEEALWFEQFTDAVEQGKQNSTLALEYYSKLREFYGENHPIILQCKSMLRLQELKEKARLKLQS